jgi:hypothetical protein
MKKNRLLVYGIILTIIPLIMFGNRVSATSHSCTILNPYNNQQFNDLYQNDYEYYQGTAPNERNIITFNFRIINNDNYYHSYKAMISGVYDPLFNDLDWGSHVIEYSSGLFLEKYGRGTFTFKIICFHAIPNNDPFGFDKGFGDPYIPDDQYTLIPVDEVTVTFSVNPTFVHFLGFGFNQSDQFKGDVLPFRDLLRDENHGVYHTGHFDTMFDWTESGVESKINELDVKEKSHDIVVISFSTHGSTSGMHASNGDIIEPDELRDYFSVLECEYLIVIIHSCHSGTFNDQMSLIENKHHIMMGSYATEPIHVTGGVSDYDPSWTIENKLSNVDPLFIKSFYSEVFAGKSTLDAFTEAYLYTVYESTHTQHPMEAIDFVSNLYLSIP